MTVFEAVKNNTDMVSVAKHYGVRIGNTKMINCIFHDDKHPSMKLYEKNYHCFGCGAHGDVISFVSQLMQKTPYEAAKCIAEDFGIKYDAKGRGSISRVLPKPNSDIVKLLEEYIRLLENNVRMYAPGLPDEELHPLYVEGLHRLPMCRYYFDILSNSNMKELKEFIKDERRFINEMRTKLRQQNYRIS